MRQQLLLPSALLRPQALSPPSPCRPARHLEFIAIVPSSQCTSFFLCVCFAAVARKKGWRLRLSMSGCGLSRASEFAHIRRSATCCGTRWYASEREWLLTGVGRPDERAAAAERGQGAFLERARGGPVAREVALSRARSHNEWLAQRIEAQLSSSAGLASGHQPCCPQPPAGPGRTRSFPLRRTGTAPPRYSFLASLLQVR